MRKALLDTDILSEILKGRNENVRARSLGYLGQFGRLSISVVSVTEVVKGLQKAKREAQLKRFLSSLESMEVIGLDVDSAILAGRIYGDLERKGQPIGRADPLIAGIALAHGLILATGNTDHYERIREIGHALDLEDWREPV